MSNVAAFVVQCSVRVCIASKEAWNMSLGPFDPSAIGAGIFTNLGYDILKHRAQSLDGTLAGKMLKWAGIIEPNASAIP